MDHGLPPRGDAGRPLSAGAWRRRAGEAGLSRAVLAICMAALAGIVFVNVVFVNTAAGYGFFPIGRDSFPVFDDPPMLSAAEAEARLLIHPRDAVIGVAHGREAKAYPIAVMGIHELGNDTIDGVPIAVSW